MAKVLYLITKSNWGGAQRYVFDLATHLPANFEPIVAVGGDGLLVQKLREKNIRVIPLPEAARDISLIKEAKLLIRLFKIIRDERPQVLHVNSSKLGGLGAFVGWATWTRTIFTAHGWPFNEDRPWYWKKLSYFFSWLTSMFATITITITQKDFEQGKRMWFVGHKMRMVHNAIGQINFYDRQTARELLSRSDLKNLNQRSDLWVGTIGELHKNKGFIYLAKAAEQIKNVKFVIMGEGEERPVLEKTNLTLAGQVPEASRYLKAFDIFADPSLKAGLQYVLLEAAQAELPVVASNVGGNPDVVGDAGMLIPPKNSELLARSLSALIKDEKLRHTLGQQLQSRVAKEFNFKNFLSQTYKLYN
ncbi:MAG: hypothetical protein A3I39_02600 [Candidatus Yanofskybacteria bacterium RIFCSPLOWO2_02_FULL_47_9b]|uniref:Glycosyltransferase subfamily 4-like N-terminal domain-containing protein n=1 Tax=Candidatus Yanofskybacteria bacterium RIFCSPLOWO2_02_FULL_47_9b TaxID=1802708 RepID=A0A1F8H8D6_9BACT|nr:MAG: hypothetical protein A3I39_02600 [Candidatus Yanofskybacteria bacterium RIFCSPLOWO2_02_FULL_47_9b]